jgi:hypothetical protein
MFAEIQNGWDEIQNRVGLDSRGQGVYALEPAWNKAWRGGVGFTLVE